MIFGVCYSRDGKWVVSAGADKTVKVWDAHTGKEIRSLQGHTGRVLSVAFSRDSKRIVSGSDDMTGKVWDVATWAEVCTLKGHRHLVTSVAFSPDGKRIVSGSVDRTAKVWDARSGARHRSQYGGGPPSVPSPAARAATIEAQLPMPYSRSASFSDVFRSVASVRRPMMSAHDR